VAVAVAAVLAAGANALAAASSGDSCTASGNGSTYTLHITMPAGTQQYGFAFGASGATVTNAVIPGSNGSFSTQNLAPNTSGAWISDSPLSGAPVASVTLSGQMTGSLRVVPASGTQPTYMSPVTCKLANVASRTAVFSVASRPSYMPAAHAWRLSVAIAGAGTVSAKEAEPTIGTAAPQGATAKPYVHVKQVSLKTPGKVTLSVRPTAAGSQRLAAHGSLKIHLLVTFDAATGKSASKLVTLTLRK
jgi:hypothetical protein